jgi:hypothetical protein
MTLVVFIYINEEVEMFGTTVWNDLVDGAKDCIRGWLDYTGITIDVWNDLCGGDRDYWDGCDSDYWKLSFANSVLDDVDFSWIPYSVLAFWKPTAKEEGRFSDLSTHDDILYACAEVAWREAIWEAEELLSKTL